MDRPQPGLAVFPKALWEPLGPLNMIANAANVSKGYLIWMGEHMDGTHKTGPDSFPEHLIATAIRHRNYRHRYWTHLLILCHFLKSLSPPFCFLWCFHSVEFRAGVANLSIGIGKGTIPRLAKCTKGNHIYPGQQNIPPVDSKIYPHDLVASQSNFFVNVALIVNKVGHPHARIIVGRGRGEE